MADSNRRRTISVKVLPGEPTDGSGRVCIHLFVQDKKGLFVEPHVLHPTVQDGVEAPGMLEARPTRGRLACDRMRRVAPVTRNGATVLTLRTDDPRAVTCPKCIASEEYTVAMERLGTV